MGGYGAPVSAAIIDRANEIHADNKQKKDEEHARKISDLILERQGLVNKIPTMQQGTPEYDEAHKQLQGVIGDLREVYHPQTNPGAIEKFGHLLTDSLKITNPQQRAQKESEKHEAVTAGNAAEADRALAAAPLTPEQLNAQKIQAQLKEIDNSNLDDEGKKRAREKVFGVTSIVKPNWQQFKLPDGTIRSFDLNNPDSDIPDGATEVLKGSITTAKETIAEYQQELKDGKTTLSYPAWVAAKRREGAPSTSLGNEYAAAYAKAYGITPQDLTPDDWSYINRKMAFDKNIPQVNVLNTTKQNFQQQWVPIQETNTKSPGGGAPAPPRGKPVNNTPPPSLAAPTPAEATPGASAPPAPQAGAPPAASTPAAPTSPKELKDEAKKRDPRAASAPSTGGGRGANASVKVGTPLFAAPTKAYSDAMATYNGALVRQTQMHKNLKDAMSDKGNQQAQLSLLFNHIGMTQGAQKGARINQKSVEEAKASAPWIDTVIAKGFHQEQNGDWVFDGYKDGVNLTPDQMKQMVDLADESTETFKENLERIVTQLNDGVQHPTSPNLGGGKAGQSKGVVSVKDAMKKDKYKNMPKEQVMKAITAQGYTPLDD